MFLKEEERIETLKACRDCPMCHMTDTVAFITGSESNTPRGRAMTLWGLEKGLLSWESEGVQRILYQAFLDGLAREWCEGHYDHDELVLDGRRRLVEKGLGPPVVARVSRNLQESGNPWGKPEEPLTSLVEAAGAKIRSSPEVVVYFGSAARVERISAARALVQVLDRMEDSFEILEKEPDSGFLSYQLGDFPSAARQAQHLTALLSRCRAKRLLVLGGVRLSNDQYALWPLGRIASERNGDPSRERIFATADGAETPHFCADDRPQGDLPRSLRFGPLHLRPRPAAKILTELAGSNFTEMEFHGKKALPCGGCGGVPFTDPEISERAARLRIDEALRRRAEILASADPGCEVHLAQAARGTPLFRPEPRRIDSSGDVSLPSGAFSGRWREGRWPARGRRRRSKD
jgi:Fe-S oxidoreductase